MNTEDRTWSGKAETSISQEAGSEGVSSIADEREKSRMVISNARDCFVEVMHRESDPSIWIVRRSKKTFWFKKRISSDWFNNRQQAFAYASEMKKEHNRHRE
jgi:1,2-phenylacetyl-CoA epoxidase PaaB subunit